MCFGIGRKQGAPCPMCAGTGLKPKHGPLSYVVQFVALAVWLAPVWMLPFEWNPFRAPSAVLWFIGVAIALLWVSDNIEVRRRR